jgi:hypothetical protein
VRRAKFLTKHLAAFPVFSRNQPEGFPTRSRGNGRRERSSGTNWGHFGKQSELSAWDVGGTTGSVAAKPAEIDRAARMPPSVKLLDNGGGDRDRLVCACGVKAEDRSVCVNLAVIPLERRK